MKVKPANKPLAWVLNRFNFAAITSPWKTVYILPEFIANERILKHEACHIAQMERDGWLKFWVQCLYWFVKYRYWDSPYEIEARAAEDQ